MFTSVGLRCNVSGDRETPNILDSLERGVLVEVPSGGRFPVE